MAAKAVEALWLKSEQIIYKLPKAAHGADNIKIVFRLVSERPGGLEVLVSVIVLTVALLYDTRV